jgi:hypothetical protein
MQNNCAVKMDEFRSKIMMDGWVGISDLNCSRRKNLKTQTIDLDVTITQLVGDEMLITCRPAGAASKRQEYLKWGKRRDTRYIKG